MVDEVVPVHLEEVIPYDGGIAYCSFNLDTFRDPGRHLRFICKDALYDFADLVFVSLYIRLVAQLEKSLYCLRIEKIHPASAVEPRISHGHFVLDVPVFVILGEHLGALGQRS